MSLMSNVIETIRSTGSDYWAAYVGGEKIKTDGLKRHTRTDVITHYWPTLVLVHFIKIKSNWALARILLIIYAKWHPWPSDVDTGGKE